MKKSTVIVSEKYQNLFFNSDLSCDLDILYIPENPNVDEKLSGHTDLSVFKLNNSTLIMKNYLKGSTASTFLSQNNVTIIYDDSFQSFTYPYDCGLNAALIGNKLICNKKTASGILINECKKAGYEPIFVKQGYTKCSICPINEKAAITSDEGIYKALTDENLDIMLIKNDFIKLSGFNNGFFGGSAFMPDGNTLILTGKIPDKDETDKLHAFLSKYQVKIKYLSNDIISDIGGCIVI